MRESSGRVFNQQRPLLISAAAVSEVGSVRCVPVFIRKKCIGRCYFWKKMCTFARDMENYYHRMDRRSKHKRYGLPGTYHVTIKVNMVYRQALGRVVGDINAADGSPQAPHVELNEAGRMVEQGEERSVARKQRALLIKDTAAADSREIVSLPAPTSFTPCK